MSVHVYQHTQKQHHTVIFSYFEKEIIYSTFMISQKSKNISNVTYTIEPQLSGLLLSDSPD